VGPKGFDPPAHRL